MEHNTIGTRIEWLRKENGQTQKEVADAIGVRRETINQWESGTRDLKTGAIIALAKHFNVSSDYILGLSDTKSTSLEIKAICDYTGLWEDTVKLFANDNLSDDKNEIDAVNMLCATYPSIMFLRSLGIFHEAAITQEKLLSSCDLEQDAEIIVKELQEIMHLPNFKQKIITQISDGADYLIEQNTTSEDHIDLLAYDALKWFNRVIESLRSSEELHRYKISLCALTEKKFLKVLKEKHGLSFDTVAAYAQSEDEPQKKEDE